MNASHMSGYLAHNAVPRSAHFHSDGVARLADHRVTKQLQDKRQFIFILNQFT